MPDTLARALTDGRLRLRRVDLTDVDALFQAVRDSQAEIGRWMPWAHPGFTRDESANWLAGAWLGWDAGKAYEFAVTLDGDDTPIGMCGLNGISGGAGNLGYWIHSDQAGKGLATAAARLVARFGFEHLKLRRIRLFHAIGNEGSRRVAEKVGFQLEGRQRAQSVLQDEPVDTLLYSLISLDELR